MAWVEKASKTTFRVRYSLGDGDGRGSVTGFASKTAAENYAGGMETDQRRGTFVDPEAGKTTLGEWTVDWLDALDVSPDTEDYYRSFLKNHILPRWGDTAVADISSIRQKAWAKRLREHYAESTVTGITKLLTLLLSDAVDEQMIPANPLQTRRRRRRTHTRAPERPWVTPEQALLIADGIAQLPAAGPWDAMLVVTGAWTGARWGELAGLQRPNLHLDLDRLDDPGANRMVVNPETGALHENSRGLYLGPPKTPESARDIHLPPFLARLLAHHLDTHPHPMVFPTQQGAWHRRSNFSRRAFQPGARGTADKPRSAVALPPVRPGLTPHGLRHSHKTWMIADAVPEIAQAQRLGHVLSDKIAQTYSHVEPQVLHRLLDALQDRWDKAVAEHGTIPGWRAAADPRSRPSEPVVNRGHTGGQG